MTQKDLHATDNGSLHRRGICATIWLNFKANPYTLLLEECAKLRDSYRMSDDWEEFQKGLKRTMFSPASEYDDPKNCKMTLVVHKDGSITQRHSLHTATAEQREELICLHYLKNAMLCFGTEGVGVDFLSRDDPWDFEIGLSNGEHFFVEVTSIADSEAQFKADKREEYLAEFASKETVRVRDVKKLLRFFSLDALEAVEGDWPIESADSEIPNPIKNPEKFLLYGNPAMRDDEIVTKTLNAIMAKVGKPHGDKETTRLIIDCRCRIVDAADHKQIVEQLSPLMADMPFAEIWFYVGYYSDDDGNHAAFTFAPLKLPDKKWSTLEEVAAKRGTCADGGIVF